MRALLSNFFITLRINDLEKYIPFWNLKCYVFLLRHWLPMTSILFGIVRICVSLFKRNYLKNEKIFLNFLFLFLNLHQLLNIFKKQNIVIADVFPKLQTLRDLVRALYKKRRFRSSFDSQHVKESQTLLKFV